MGGALDRGSRTDHTPGVTLSSSFILLVCLGNLKLADKNEECDRLPSAARGRRSLTEAAEPSLINPLRSELAY